MGFAGKDATEWASQIKKHHLGLKGSIVLEIVDAMDESRAILRR